MSVGVGAVVVADPWSAVDARVGVGVVAEMGASVSAGVGSVFCAGVDLAISGAGCTSLAVGAGVGTGSGELNVSDTRSVIIFHCGPRSGFPWRPREQPRRPDRVTTPTSEFSSPV